VLFKQTANLKLCPLSTVSKKEKVRDREVIANYDFPLIAA
jgi:hypothetical protein